MRAPVRPAGLANRPTRSCKDKLEETAGSRAALYGLFAAAIACPPRGRAIVCEAAHRTPRPALQHYGAFLDRGYDALGEHHNRLLPRHACIEHDGIGCVKRIQAVFRAPYCQ